jgi:hypothetical protein
MDGPRGHGADSRTYQRDDKHHDEAFRFWMERGHTGRSEDEIITRPFEASEKISGYFGGRKQNALPSGSIARLHHPSSAAVTTLGKMMLEPGTPPSTRVRAADSILDHTTKAIEIEDIEARCPTGAGCRSISATVVVKAMITRSLARRLERLEAYRMPSSSI